MTLVLELPPELETELVSEAAQLHLPVEEYALRLLSARPILGAKPRNGAELLAYWRSAGLVGTRSDITDAPGHARALRQQAERRERS
jgi:hypothetical protein